MRDFPTGTLTLLFTNIESSTLLLQLAAEGYAGLLDTSRSLLRARFLTSHPWPTARGAPALASLARALAHRASAPGAALQLLGLAPP